ncbi:MAG TPA: cation diffusion facilitator family transporter [Bacteroidales bacterium]|jgi:cation diffusion facilitator family transporter|nr:cation transporter [Bacteroidales bacterium]HOF16861.1 cation diffusion facilitator family transporter [Bacteroidales bacterium]HOR81990.1 cation diffusion facilitator family transporter [Bacteroidales bacterium]HPJ91513.1 cation diffusion facilitator family transporter [Bacteroidales bacterium]HPX60123.1 cation diffusion facilitator family transporter [Bacteroidales bacterium]
MTREKTLTRVSYISAAGNAVLSVAKIVIGIISGSLAVLGDGIDSAMDVLISFVMIFTARILRRPPNYKYVYGYNKAEGVATKILSLIIFYAGIQMLVSSTQSFFSSETKVMPSIIAIYVTVFSIVGKLILAWYQYRKGKKIDSSMLIANAVNMRNDVLISVSVLLGLVFTFILKMPILDSVAGFIVGIFILKSAIGIFIDSNIELLDGVKDESVYQKIFEAVDETTGAFNPHRVRSRKIGDLYQIVLDIEADPNITIKEAHDISEAVEKNIRQKIENIYDIIIHVEPIGSCSKNEKFGIDKNYHRLEKKQSKK